MDQIRLLIAEDHTIVRDGLVNILSGYPDICIVAEAENGKAMVDKFTEFNPDVIMSDINMPDMDGIEAAKTILSKNPNAKIVFLTMYKTDDYIFRCYKAGAYGMVSKDVIKHELIFAIRKAFAGEKYFMGKPEYELHELVNKYEKGETSYAEENIGMLSNREKMILELIAKGLKSTEIADRLNISKRTVDSSRVAIMEKLNIKSLPQLIKFAVEISFKKKDPPST